MQVGDMSHVPNILSFFRVIAAPFFFFMVTSQNSFAVQSGVALFIIGAMTDYFDGFIARRNKIVSAFGKFIDPLADKFLTTAAFFAFVRLDVIPLWMVVVIVVRDFGMTALRLYGDRVRQPIVTSRSAKIKTFLQMCFIAYVLTLLTFQYLPFPALAAETRLLMNSTVTYLVMLALTLYTVWTIVEYLFFNRILVARLCRIPLKETP